MLNAGSDSKFSNKPHHGEHRAGTTSPILTQDNSSHDSLQGFQTLSHDQTHLPDSIQEIGRLSHVSCQTHSLCSDVRYLAEIRREKSCKETRREEWKLAANVIDRFFFLVFISVIIFSTVAVFLRGRPQIEA